MEELKRKTFKCYKFCTFDHQYLIAQNFKGKKPQENGFKNLMEFNITDF
jgi:hypothetical protein